MSGVTRQLESTVSQVSYSPMFLGIIILAHKVSDHSRSWKNFILLSLSLFPYSYFFCQLLSREKTLKKKKRRGGSKQGSCLIFKAEFYNTLFLNEYTFSFHLQKCFKDEKITGMSLQTIKCSNNTIIHFHLLGKKIN